MVTPKELKELADAATSNLTENLLAWQMQEVKEAAKQAALDGLYSVKFLPNVKVRSDLWRALKGEGWSVEFSGEFLVVKW